MKNEKKRVYDQKRSVVKILFTLVGFLWFDLAHTFAQETAMKIVYIDSLPSNGVVLNKGWKFHAGDSGNWANPTYDDSHWKDINPTKELNYLPEIRKEPVGWFRLKLHIDSSLLNKPLAFTVFQSIASEIYLDGTLLKRYGVVSHKGEEVDAIQPINLPVGIQFNESDQVFAVRFSVENDLPYLQNVIPYSAFRMSLNDVESAAAKYNMGGNRKLSVLNGMYTGVYLVLTIIHLGLFVMYRKQKANLFFSIATASGAIANSLFISIIYSNDISFRVYASLVDWLFLLTFFNLFLFIAVHLLFLPTRRFLFWFVVVYCLASPVIWVSNIFQERGELLGFMLPFWISMGEALRIAWSGYRKKRRDAGILVFALAAYLVFYSVFILLYEDFISNRNIGFGDYFSLTDAMYTAGIMSVPLGLSLFLSRDFAFTSKELEKQLQEIRHLSAKTIEQELEKQQLLASQNETLEKQVKERTFALSQSLEHLKTTQSQLIQSEKMASLGQLTAGIAHEIQNPLNFVNNFSEINTDLLGEMNLEIENGNYDEVKTLAQNVTDNHQKINHHGKRADAIVKAMLQHSRSSGGVKELTDINVLADEYFRLAFHGLRANNKSFNATMKTAFDQNIGKIEVVPQDIGRVMLNLITNAFYAVHQKQKEQQENYEPSVSVTTRKDGNNVIIIVADNGNGIPQKHLDKIFQPFFTTKPAGQGTGLGLSLSYDIVQAHGGKITATTKEGEGSEFIIELPGT